jgi:LuxR family transcriptional regulator, quorum-sensing system regulator SdiA
VKRFDRMMLQKIAISDLSEIAPAGYYLALRVGFAFPLEEINALPADWVSHYTVERYVMADPVIRWVYSHTGSVRWSEIDSDDPRGVLSQARKYGLCHGVAVSVFDNNPDGQRSFGTFARSDREFTELEIDLLSGHIQRLHVEKAPPSNLTFAELEALRMVRDGLRVKQIAFELGVSEGAVKQRLKNAKLKLGAQTGAQAAAMASEFGLI